MGRGQVCIEGLSSFDRGSIPPRSTSDIPTPAFVTGEIEEEGTHRNG